MAATSRCLTAPRETRSDPRGRHGRPLLTPGHQAPALPGVANRGYLRPAAGSRPAPGHSQPWIAVLSAHGHLQDYRLPRRTRRAARRHLPQWRTHRQRNRPPHRSRPPVQINTWGFFHLTRRNVRTWSPAPSRQVPVRRHGMPGLPHPPVTVNGGHDVTFFGSSRTDMRSNCSRTRRPEDPHVRVGCAPSARAVTSSISPRPRARAA
jgi:hypothetical protein